MQSIQFKANTKHFCAILFLLVCISQFSIFSELISNSIIQDTQILDITHSPASNRGALTNAIVPKLNKTFAVDIFIQDIALNQITRLLFNSQNLSARKNNSSMTTHLGLS